MDYRRMPIEKESPEEFGYGSIDNNLSESSVTDMNLADALGGTESAAAVLSKVTLLYTVHMGDLGLREAICGLYSATSSGITPDDVLVVPGAAAALFMIHTALLRDKSDHIVVQFPNYGTNVETPVHAIGASHDFVPASFESGFVSKWTDFRDKIRDSTRLISVTSPHNPSGVSQLSLIRDLAENVLPAHPGLFLLADETYRDVSGTVTDPLGASLHPRCISVSSMSKAFGLPGIRMGWIIVKDAVLKEKLLAAKEQIFITNSVVDEEICRHFLQHRMRDVMPTIRARTERNYVYYKQWMSENTAIIEWVDPELKSCVSFPRVCAPGVDIAKFHETLVAKYKTFVGPGRWFGMPDNYIRIGFGYPTYEQLVAGLAAIKAAIADATQK